MITALYNGYMHNFDAQFRALKIPEETHKKGAGYFTLTTEDDALWTILAVIGESNIMSYAGVKIKLIGKSSDEWYTKLRNLKFRAGTRISEFLHELRIFICTFLQFNWPMSTN